MSIPDKFSIYSEESSYQIRNTEVICNLISSSYKRHTTNIECDAEILYKSKTKLTVISLLGIQCKG